MIRIVLLDAAGNEIAVAEGKTEAALCVETGE